MKIQQEEKTVKVWQAWYNVQPGGLPTLHVIGEVDTGDTSVGAQLVFHSIEKSNPPNLVLQVVPTTIFIPDQEGDTKVKVHYSEQIQPHYYGDVKIYVGEDVSVTPVVIEGHSIPLIH